MCRERVTVHVAVEAEAYVRITAEQLDNLPSVNPAVPAAVDRAAIATASVTTTAVTTTTAITATAARLRTIADKVHAVV